MFINLLPLQYFMKQLLKAQIFIGSLVCFSLIWGLFQDVLIAQDFTNALILAVIQLIAFFVLSIILLTLMEWLRLFDLKTNAILTYLCLVVIQLTLIY